MNVQNNNNSENVEIYIYWLTDNRNIIEYKSFKNMVKNIKNSEPNITTSINILISKISKIYFKNTFIIITESIYENFISKFLEKINEINVIPKFIIYSREKSYQNNKNKSFYKYGGKLSSFNEILNLIQKDNIVQINEISSFSDTLRVKSVLYRNKEQQEIKFIFDPIESLEQMYLPTYYKIMIKIKEEDEKKFDKFTQLLYNEYKNIDDIENLLSQIINIKNIPKELLCKYWARCYTSYKFHYDINDYLNKGKSGKYTLFIKMMYEGVRLKIFESPIKNVIYRGAHMTNIEIQKIKECLNNKKNKICSGILFCRAFLSFSCSKSKAIEFAFKNNFYNRKTMKRVLFVLKSNPNINETFNTHADITKYSFFPNEKEILFFPFSCFDIMGIKSIVERDEDLVQIELGYLSIHDSRLRNKDNFTEEDINKSLIDSEFKKEIKETNIIDKNEIDKSSISSIIDNSISFIEEEKNIIENNISINQKNLKDILNELSNDNVSSNELLEISHDNIYVTQNININIINNNNGNNHINNLNFINNNKCKCKKSLLILILIIVIIIIVSIIIAVLLIKKKKSNDAQINTVINSDIIDNSYIIENSNNIDNTEKIEESIIIKKTNKIEEDPDDYYPNFDENSEEYKIALAELKEVNKIRRQKGVQDLKLDLELTNLAYDDVMEILTTSNINIGGHKNNEGEYLIQYIHIYNINNTYIPGVTSEAFYNSRQQTLTVPDCLISDMTTHYGFGVIRLSEGYLAVAFLYPPCTGGQDLIAFDE